MANPSIGRRVQLPTSLSQRPTIICPTLDDHHHQFVGLFGSQKYLLESSIEMSNFDSDGTTTVATHKTEQLIIIPFGETTEEQHPTSEFEIPDSQNEQPVISIQLSDHDSSIVTERGEDQSIGDEDQSIDLRLTENVVSDIENQIESTAINMENPENDSSNHPLIATLIATPPQIAQLHGCSDPKDVSYLLRVYPVFIGLVAGKTLWEKNTPFPIVDSLMIISIVVYAMAYVNLLILSCIYDGLPRQSFLPVHYKISKYVFYILCFLAPFLLLPLLFIHRD